MNATLMDCDQQTYRDDPAIAQSDLKMFRRSKLEFYRTKITGEIQPTPPTPQQLFGIRVEAMLRDGFQSITERYQIIPSTVLSKGGTRAGKAWNEWKLEALDKHPGAELVTPDEFAELTYVLRTIDRHIDAHESAKRLIRGIGFHEPQWNMRIKWDDDGNAIERKAELDLVMGNISGEVTIVDVKTSRSTSADGFAREVVSWGYDIQCVWYQQALRELWKCEPRFLFVVIRNAEPYDVAVYELEADWIAQAHKDCANLLEQLSACLAGDVSWINHDGLIAPLRRPAYAQYQDVQARELDADLFNDAA